MSASLDPGPDHVGPRYALYYLPPADSGLWRLGCRWLGRDRDSGYPASEGSVPPPYPDQHGLTQAPGHYGLHATLKPPFRLHHGCDETQLVDALRRFCVRHAPIPIPPLALALMDGFVALRPEREHAPLNALAAACVRKFDTFRASLSDGELRRRRQSPLNERQERMLQRWGYPYVMECFRFHITLTRRLEADEIEPVMMHLRVYLAAALHEPQRVDGIALCHQPDARTPFRVVIRIPLQGGGAGW